MSILVIGRGGQLARALVDRAHARGVALRAMGRPELDLERVADVAAIIAQEAPAVVINAAAYTAVDKAEDEVALAHRVNGEATGAMARAASGVGAAFIQVSTDYVFDGAKPTPYVETDATGPTGVYGASKLAGEEKAAAANPHTIVLRTAWVFDASGSNFVRTMLRLARTREEVGVVADQRGCPTFAGDLADAVLAVAARADRYGLYHCAGAGEASWAEFADEIFRQSRALGGPSARVRPIAAADYPTRARRPANSRLDCSKLAADYGVRMRSWPEALRVCMEEIAVGGWRLE